MPEKCRLDIASLADQLYGSANRNTLTIANISGESRPQQLEDMHFSIVTPNLNNARFVEGCIKSVLIQGCDVEHIVVDGQSEDESLDIIGKYPHVILVSERDCGMYDAINKGIRRATGEIVAYLNADDRYAPGALKIVEQVSKNHISADYFFGACTYINKKGEEIYTYKPPPLPRALFKNICSVWWAQPSTFWRKTSFEKVGFFDPELKYCGDYEFMKRCINVGLHGVRIEEVLSYFMLHDERLSERQSVKMAAEQEAVRHRVESAEVRLGDVVLDCYCKLYNIRGIFRKYMYRLARAFKP